MLRIFHGTNYDFIRPWRIAVGVTIAFIVAGFVMLGVHEARYGSALNQSIEFTGGTLMQLEFTQPPNVGDIRATVDAAGFPNSEIQQFGSPREFTVRAGGHAEGANAAVETTANQIQAALTQKFGAGTFKVVRTEIVGPRVGEELTRNAIIAILLSLVITMIYLAFRFEWRFGVAAVIATVHDLLSTLAFLAIMRLEVSLTVIAALLTVIGYSLNDTIIIFDRVREDLKKNRTDSLYTVLNKSINETLPRSVLTHVTVAAATLSLLLFAGEVIRPFSWIMLFGIVTGTFSSIYIAGPVLLWIERRWPRAKGDRNLASRAAAKDAVRPETRTPVGAR
ncbi:MAG: protein translocase subunit SecF [Gemmatimonadaceae bacterium]|nr:protein translocase subunit SecF [Gemmatimonadaceae bacterium]NUO93765.1 protein translocase subunit SecF [Gemmatimonadaceae bacterium]NUP55850.1 protein translocase subunit SecF [Gemmatimonadaceae bacterium]NUP72381.1 protein translocase subunit SecF [Gemmatimonadaceae bacterium]NUR32869.1 protein translocase subunit SecF [Gemmatimonadaceae bacterium]